MSMNGPYPLLRVRARSRIWGQGGQKPQICERVRTLRREESASCTVPTYCTSYAPILFLWSKIDLKHFCLFLVFVGESHKTYSSQLVLVATKSFLFLFFVSRRVGTPATNSNQENETTDFHRLSADIRGLIRGDPWLDSPVEA